MFRMHKESTLNNHYIADHETFKQTITRNGKKAFKINYLSKTLVQVKLLVRVVLVSNKLDTHITF